jgi:hypothetical protein
VSEPFFFGVPLIARAVARDWEQVDQLLRLTLRSVLAQSDPDFRLILAGHDRPDCWAELTAGDLRFRFVEADWEPEPPNRPNDDGGRKKALVKEHVRAAGGGLLMFLDADDLVDRDLVRLARATIDDDHVGGLVGHGVAIDHPSLRAAAFPVNGVFDGPFHQLCGSSTIARIDPESDDWTRFDPHLILGSHDQWLQTAQRLGVRLARLPAWGGYLVGTAQSHSENDGPFAVWRRTFTRGVRRVGRPMTHALAGRLGLSVAELSRHRLVS